MFGHAVLGKVAIARTLLVSGARADVAPESQVDPARAFPLLAADAFVTYACEAAAEGPAFAGDCRRILATFGTRFDR